MVFGPQRGLEVVGTKSAMNDIFSASYEDDNFGAIHQLLNDPESKDEHVSGSWPARFAIIDLNCIARAKQLLDEYFGHQPAHREHKFSRRFCVSRKIFIGILKTFEKNYLFFKQQNRCDGNIWIKFLLHGQSRTANLMRAVFLTLRLTNTCVLGNPLR